MSSTRAKELGLTPMARIVAQASSGLAPKHLLMTPVEAIRRVLAKTGWTMEDVDLFEINEAFSVQLIAVLRELGLDPEKVNVNGGAVALGHPIGASGARILTTLLYALKQRRLTTGHRGAVSRRRQRRRAGGRANVGSGSCLDRHRGPVAETARKHPDGFGGFCESPSSE